MKTLPQIVAAGRSGLLSLLLLGGTSGYLLAMPAFPEFVDPHPNPGNQFGHNVVPLSTGNVVITAPFDDAGGPDAGAAYLFNGATGALISTLTGSSANDKIGSGIVTALPNGNFLIGSPTWKNGAAAEAGAVTFGNGSTGISGVVSPSNSLVGSSAGDRVANTIPTVLANGNFVLVSINWDNGSATNAGAVTFGNGNTGVSGVVSAANSLVGSASNDEVGASGVVALPNGNYVVRSSSWNNGAVVDAGAVTFGNGTIGVSGAVSSANSLVGTSNTDAVGVSGVTVLSNGNYAVASEIWNNGAVADAGAVTFGNGSTGVSGAVSSANSLVGSVAADGVGSGGVVALANGNYVVASPNWDRAAITNAGAATLCGGSSGLSGAVTVDNSLCGSIAGDQVGSRGVLALTNGNYVVHSNSWDNGVLTNAGAVTFCNGGTGIIGSVTSSNSLVGSKAEDQVGSIKSLALANGNYVARSPLWDNGAVTNVGAATFCNGSSGRSGAVTLANSLTGSTTSDQVGSGSVLALGNGNYVLGSPLWNNGAISDAGAATFGSGLTGVSGAVSASNSLVGGGSSDQVGNTGFLDPRITELVGGNYVVNSQSWSNGSAVDAGAVTFGSGITGVSGTVSASNSIVGSSSNDGGGCRVVPLKNGNYLASFPLWDHGAALDAGAVILGSGTTGGTGVISSANSLVGTTANDRLGEAIALSNGNFVVCSPDWTNGTKVLAGAATFGNGTTGVTGVVNASNSVLGQEILGDLKSAVEDTVNGIFMVPVVDQGAGKVHVGSVVDGFTPTPEISVFAGNPPLPANEREDNAGTQGFGTVVIGGSAMQSFTIQSVGAAGLTGLTVTAGGADAGSFSVDTTGMSATLGSGASTGFNVTFSATGGTTAVRTAVLLIGSNDTDENPFEIHLTGTALSLNSDTDSDGLNDATEFLMAALGFNWELSQPSLVNTLNSHIGGASSNLNTAGYFSSSQIQDLNLTTPLIQRHPTTGVFTLTLGLEKSGTLAPGSFTPLPMNGPGSSTSVNGAGKLEFQFSSPDDAAFFRLGAQ